MTNEAVWLECPVCEYRFSVPSDYLNKSGKCPKCEKVFLAADCQLPEKELREELKEPEVPLPAVLSQEISAASPPNQPPVSAGKPAPESSPTRTVDPEQTFVAKEKNHTDPNKVLIWVSVSCLLAIGLLIGIPVAASMMLNRDQPGDSGGQNVASNPASNATGNTANKNKNEPAKKKKKGGGKAKKGGAGKAKKSNNAKPDKTVVNLTEEELRSLWATCHTGIVLVVAKFGEENRQSHGVVVSDDGKIAVSRSAITGADSVRVRFAATEYGAEERWSKPKTATAIFSEKPELDLAIIQVNGKTRAVTSRTLAIQPNERGIIPALSNRTSKEFLRQTRLRTAVSFSSLTDGERECLTSQSLKPADNEFFAIHSAKLNKNGVGAPVFDEKGQFVGMHLAHHADSKKSFVLPPMAIQKVLNRPSGDPIALSGSPAKSASGGSKEVAATAPDISETLQKLGTKVWNYHEPAGYATFQDFSVGWWNVNKEYLKADFTRRIKIEELKVDMANRMNKHLFWASADDIQKTNNSAIEAFQKKEKGWFALVSVLKPAGLAMDVEDEPAILVKLAGTEEKALLIPGDVEGPFLSGSEWMVFGLNQDSTRLSTSDGKCMVIHLAGAKKR